MEDQSFEAFVTSCLPALSQYAYRLTGDRDSCDDLVQDTLVRLAGSWRRIHIEGNPVGYAQRAMVRTHISRWRWRRRRPTTEPYEETIARDGDRYAAVDTRDVLRRALAILPRLQRTVLVLTYVDDMPDDRIADLINRRPATVRSLRHRGLAAIRDRLDHLELVEAPNGTA